MDNIEVLPFHRKYRPSKLDDYIGNTKIVDSIMRTLKDNNRPQVMLFSGHAGCGKTSMARLVAKEYLCEDRSDDTGACGKCQSCLELEHYIESGDAGNLVYVREVDNADSNKKQDVEALIEEAMFPAFGGSWRVFIFDESHMMSYASQARLLKFTEEPPEKVLLIFCTTNPEKMDETLLSRCQYKFKVVRPQMKELIELLERVVQSESVNYEKKALAKIIIKGDFIPRNSLITVEQVIKERGDVNVNNTLETLGEVEDSYYTRFLEYMSSKGTGVDNVYEYITMLVEIKMKMDLNLFVVNLMTFMKRGIYAFYGILQEGLDDAENKQLSKLFKSFDSSQIVYLLNFLIEVRNDTDIESKLILLGFTKTNSIGGFLKQESEPVVAREKLIADELKQSSDNFGSKLEPAEEDIAEILVDDEEVTDVNWVLDAFQASVVAPKVE
jgi:DNA polymerase-3 subunit gamma/tau